MTRLPDPLESIDWKLTTFREHRREQMRRWAALPLDRMIAAIEEMEALAAVLRAPEPQKPESPPGNS